ncbi:MAG: ABC transporter substrate-binding protein [Erythrobacter sp.]
MKRLLISCLAIGLFACDDGSTGGPLDIAVIGNTASSSGPFGPQARYLRAAGAEGLVALDPEGQVIPAIAQRWIVTDDAMSYIFRMRDSTWPDDEPIGAEDVRDALEARIRALRGTALGLDLAKITEVRAMTGQIVEIRLSSPMPEFLRLLAQPELGLMRSGSGAGPMVVSFDEDAPLSRLSVLPPTARGLPEPPEGREPSTRPLTLTTMSAPRAVRAFDEGSVDLVLGGTIANFPLAQPGPLSRGTIQVDPALGLFGLVFTNDVGLLSDPARREALSMAIDRAALIEPFGLGGWQPTTWVVPQSLFSPLQYPATRWSEFDLEQRRAEAAGRIGAWEEQAGARAQVSIALPAGPGGDILFREIEGAWSRIGVETRRVPFGEQADLFLLDVTARYSSPRWFLNRFNCTLDQGLCSPEADALVAESLVQRVADDKQSLLADAHFELIANEVFIPLGSPVRWSLVRGAVTGYEPNPWALHPLFPMAGPTI